MKKSALVFLAFALAAALPARAEIVFSGLIAGSSKSLFGLVDKTTGTQRWVAVGEKFQEYEVTSYDAKAHALTLKKGDVLLMLNLAAENLQTAKGVDSLSRLNALEGLDLAFALAEMGNEPVSDLVTRLYEASEAQDESEKKSGKRTWLAAQESKNETGKRAGNVSLPHAILFIKDRVIHVAVQEREKLRAQAR